MSQSDLVWSLYRIAEKARELRRKAKESRKAWNNDRLVAELVGAVSPEDLAVADAHYREQRFHRLFASLDLVQQRLDRKDSEKDEANKSGWLLADWYICRSGPSEIEFEEADGGRGRINWADADQDQRESSERIEWENEKERRHRAAKNRRRLKRKNALMTPLAKQYGRDVASRELMKYAQINLFTQEVSS